MSEKFYKCVSFKDGKLVPIFGNKDFIYQKGLNIDIEEFNPNGECQKGGLYCCKLKELHKWYQSNCRILEAIIPENAQVYEEQDKYKTDKLFVERIWESLEFAEYLIENDMKSGAQLTLQIGATYNRLDICEWAVEKGANDFNEALRYTYNPNIIAFLKECMH